MTREGRAGRALLGLYGAWAALAGLVLATAPGPAPRPAASPAASTAAGGAVGGAVGDARVLAVATPVAPQGRPGGDPAAGAGAIGAGGAGEAGAVAARQAPAVPVGAPFRPLLLVLPGGAAAPVRESGLHPDGSLVIPDDPATVGWWDGGALAGDAFGGVVLAGHVDSARYGIGVMARLRTLQAGQVVELRSGTHRMRYRVSARSRVPQAELAARTDAFRQDVAPRLVLITCGGAFDPVRHRYQDNLIIVADPLPGG